MCAAVSRIIDLFSKFHVLFLQDQQVLDDVKSLSNYILDELNVKKLTLSTKKQDYGVMLRAEPDHKTLGFR